MSEKYDFGAFISYKRKSVDNPGLIDEKVAKKLMSLIEHYSPPRGVVGADIDVKLDRANLDTMPAILRNNVIFRFFVRFNSLFKKNHVTVFRDSEELDAVNLNEKIKYALKSSKYLIMICSKDRLKSGYCAAEYNYYKNFVNPELDRVIPIVLDNNSREVLPEELWGRSDASVLDLSGIPLIFFANNDSPVRYIKKEYLRIMASIYGCGYSVLRNRHKKRERLKRVQFLVSALILIVGIYAAGRYFVSQNNATLAASYYKTGVEYIEPTLPDRHLAMAYLSESAAINPQNSALAADKLERLLREYSWVFVESSAKGRVIGDFVVVNKASVNPPYDDGICVVSDSIDINSIVAIDKSNILLELSNGFMVFDEDGVAERLSLPDAVYLKDANNGNGWIFLGNSAFYIYNTSNKMLSSIELPSKVNPKCSSADIVEYIKPDIIVYDSGNKALISFGGYLYCCEMQEGGYSVTRELDLSSFFKNPGSMSEEYIYPNNKIFMDSNETLVGVTDGQLFSILKLISMDSIISKNSSLTLSGISFSSDSAKIAISYGADTRYAPYRRGGFFEIYGTLERKLEYSSEGIYSESVAEAKFYKDTYMVLIRGYDKIIRLWDSDILDTVMLDDKVVGAAFGTKQYIFAVETGGNKINFYSLITSSAEQITTVVSDARYPVMMTLDIGNDVLAVLTNNSLSYYNFAEKKVTQSYPAESQEYIAFLQSNRKYIQRQGLINSTEFPAIYKGMYEAGRNVKMAYNNAFLFLVSDDGTVISRRGFELSGETVMISDALLTLAGGKILVTGSNPPFIAQYGIDYEKGEIVPELFSDLNGYLPQYLWQSKSGGTVVVSTGNNELLVYPNGDIQSVPRIFELDLDMRIMEIDADVTGRFLAVISGKISTTATNSGYNRFGRVEIWNTGSLARIYEFSDGKSNVNGLCFRDNYCFYGVKGDVHGLLLPMGGLSAVRNDFFRALSGYRIVGKNSIERADAFIPAELLREVSNDEWTELYSVVRGFGR